MYQKNKKILLLGDFSSLHYCLGEAVKKLGYNIKVASGGDGWKNIPCDIRLSYGRHGVKNKLLNRLLPFIRLPMLIGYDKVQLIHSQIIPNYYLNKLFLYFIFKFNKSVYLLACGTDSRYLRSCVSKRLKYSPYDKISSHQLLSDKWVDFHESIVSRCVKVIPVLYEYKYAYSDITKSTNVIPLLCKESSYQFELSDKIVVFHGIIREDFKGSHYIREAFDFLAEKYKEEAEFVIDGNIPYEEYLKLMGKVDIVVDQCRTYGYGINGVIALSKGKVLLSGAEVESNDAISKLESPVINILPNPNDIIDKISALIDDRKRLKEISVKSYQYYNIVHHPESVSKRYLNEWFE